MKKEDENTNASFRIIKPNIFQKSFSFKSKDLKDDEDNITIKSPIKQNLFQKLFHKKEYKTIITSSTIEDNKEDIEPFKWVHNQKKIEAYLDSKDHLNLYKEVLQDSRWKDTFKPLDLLNLLQKKVQVCCAYYNDPTRVINHFKLMNLNDQQFYCFYHFLIENLEDILTLKDDVVEDYKVSPLELIVEMIKIEYVKIEKKINSETYKYDFEKVKNHLQTLNNYTKKITYLIEQKTLYQQDDSKPKDIPSPNFETKCNIEIEKLEKLSEFEEKEDDLLTSNTLSKLKLSNKLSKIDFIRILNVMYEMRMFETMDEQIPTKSEFMNTMGDYFNINLSDYSRNLSQSLQNQPSEINTRVFRNMITFIEKELCTNK